MNEHERDQANRLGRAWDAFVSGTESHNIAPDLLAEIEFAQEMLAVPSAAPATRDLIWQQVTGRSLPSAISTASVAASPNGLPATHDLAPAANVARRRDAWLAAWRIIAIGAFAGFAAGFLAGIWTRIAMRVAGFLTIDRHRYLLTEANARVGEITLGGTLFLAMFAAVIGIAGGVLYIAVRRWLPGSGIVRATSYGVLLLGVFGFFVMDENNQDYQLFGPVWLNVGTFSLTYIVYGVATSLIAESLDARVGMFSLGRSTIWGTRLATLVLTPFGFLGLGAIASVAVSGFGFGAVRIMVPFLALAIALSLASRSARWTWLQSPYVHRLGLTAALLPALLGVYLTTQGIVGILTG